MQPADCGITRAINFNYKKYPFNIKEVRQAIAWALDRKTAASVVAPEWLPQGDVNYTVPLTIDQVEKWVPAEIREKLCHYGWEIGGNRTKAREILLSLNFTIGSDGWWYTPNGTRLEFEWINEAEFVDVMAIAEALVDQLNDFGIKTTLRGVTFTDMYPRYMEGRWDMCLYAFGRGAAHPHPFFALYNMYAYNYPFGAGPGPSFPMEVNTTSLGYVNFTDLIFKSAEGFDVEYQKEVIGNFCLAWNELLPAIPIWHRISGNPILEDVRVTGWLPPDDPIYKNNPYVDSFVIIMMLKGILKPVVEEAPPPSPPRPPYELYAGVAVAVIVIIAVAAYALRKR